MHFLHAARQKRFWDQVQPSLWRSQLFGPGLIFRSKAPGKQDSYYMSCGAVDKGAVLSWPMETVWEPPFPAKLKLRVLRELEAGKPFHENLFVVADQEAYEAPELSVRGPCFQACFGEGSTGVEFELTGEHCSISKAMARRGFAGLSKAVLSELLADAGVETHGKQSEYDLTRMAILTFAPDTSAEDLLRFLARRSQHTRPLASEDFYADPAVSACFDEGDQKEIKVATAYFAGGSDFSASLTAAFKKYHAGKKKPAAKKTTKAEQQALDAEKKKVPAGTSRAEAMAFMPTGSSWKLGVYRDERNERWQAFHEVLGTFSRAFAKYSEKEAMLQCLRWLWNSVEMEGMKCPFEFLEKVEIQNK